MQLTQTLIDKAANMCGSQSKLAKSLGVTRQLVTDWKNGKSLPSEEAVGQMAMMTGIRIEDALQARAEDALARTPRGQQVLEVLRGGFLRGGVPIFAISATLAASEICQMGLDSLYIVLSRLLGFRARSALPI